MTRLKTLIVRAHRRVAYWAYIHGLIPGWQTKARTERVRATTTVKEGATGHPFLMFEAEDFPSFPDAHFGLTLKEGTTLEEARALATHINTRTGSVHALLF